MSKRVLVCLFCLSVVSGCQSDVSGISDESGVAGRAPEVLSASVSVDGFPDAKTVLRVQSADGTPSEFSVASVLVMPSAWQQNYRFDVVCPDQPGVYEVAFLTLSTDENFQAIHQVKTVVCEGRGSVASSRSFADSSVLSIAPEILTIEDDEPGAFYIGLPYEPLAPVAVLALPLSGENDVVLSNFFTDDSCLNPESSFSTEKTRYDNRYSLDVLAECGSGKGLLEAEITSSNLVLPSAVVLDDSQESSDDPESYEQHYSVEELIEFDQTYAYVRDSGTSGTFTIRPLVKPEDDVTITIKNTDPSEVTLSPEILVFTPENWSHPQMVTVTGVSDGIKDGGQYVELAFDVFSSDEIYDQIHIPSVFVQTADDDGVSTESTRIRAMSANITSGNKQAYSPGHGIRIFQAVKPDIVLIQEFNMYSGSKDSDDDIRMLVDKAFGPEFYYHHGNGELPNGIVSRYPITSSGSWKSNIIKNRDWDWAVIDIPGPKDLLAVSVHLSTDKNAQEMPVLITEIQKKIEKDEKKGIEYYLLIGGDFNTKSRKTVSSYMSSYFVTTAPYPVDQNGNSDTSAKRTSPYDYLLCSRELCKKEVPVEIGSHTGLNGYTNGHVFDTRVYAKYTIEGTKNKEISLLSPAQANDSGASNMQHMAVIRDFEITY